MLELASELASDLALDQATILSVVPLAWKHLTTREKRDLTDHYPPYNSFSLPLPANLTIPRAKVTKSCDVNFVWQLIFVENPS